MEVEEKIELILKSIEVLEKRTNAILDVARGIDLMRLAIKELHERVSKLEKGGQA